MSDIKPAAISACIITHNNERTIERCLKSLKWVDEIIVIDSFSTDSTYPICKRYADTLEQRSWPGFRDQYEHATSLAQHEWVIFVDADEEVPPELVEEIQSVLFKDPPCDGFLLYRRTHYLGRWIRHGGWARDRETRLYRKAKGRWTTGLHASVIVDGRIGTLKTHIHHYNYKDLSDQIMTIDRYSRNAAEDLLRQDRNHSTLRLILRPLARFIRDYFLKRGYKDGLPGLIIAVATSFYVFSKYAKLWELRHVGKEVSGATNECHRKSMSGDQPFYR